jgi:hypothetical protein
VHGEHFERNNAFSSTLLEFEKTSRGLDRSQRHSIQLLDAIVVAEASRDLFAASISK